MTYFIVQILAGLCAFLGIGQAVAKDTTKFDKICGFVICLLYLSFILFVERFK